MKSTVARLLPTIEEDLIADTGGGLAIGDSGLVDRVEIHGIAAAEVLVLRGLPTHVHG